MATIQPTTEPALWRVARGDEELHGVTAVGELTGIAPDATETHAEGATAFVAALEPVAEELPLLPDSGWLEQHAPYRYGDGVVVVRQAHCRTEHDPSETPALFWTTNSSNEWVVGEHVVIGAQRTYDGETYVCIQAHTTQVDYTPDVTPSLWEVYEEPQPGEQWVDSGETVTALIGAGTIGVTDTAPFAAGQQIRIDGASEATISYIHTVGTPGVLVIDPHVGVSGGESIEIWQ